MKTFKFQVNYTVTIGSKTISKYVLTSAKDEQEARTKANSFLDKMWKGRKHPITSVEESKAFAAF